MLLIVVIASVLWADRPGRPGTPGSITPRRLAPVGAAQTPGSPAAPEVGSGEQVSTTPVSGQAVVLGVSPPLRDIPVIPIEPAASIREMGEPGESDWLGGDVIRPQIEDPVLQATFTGGAPASAQAQMPALIQNFAGTGNVARVYPPDPNGDVGKNHYVQMVNLHLQIWDKSGHSVYGPVASNTIWSGTGSPCQSRNDGDPIVLYDPLAERWILSQFTTSNPFGECVAVSTTSDPTGAYYRYFFQFSTTVLYDYPKLGVWPDGYYLTANRFGTGYLGASIIALERSKMLLGQTARFIEYPTSPSHSSLLPADFDGTTLPPVNSPNYLLSLSSNALFLWKLSPNWVTGSPSFVGPTSIAIAPYNSLCMDTRNCVDQPGTSVKLDGIGDRLMYRLVYRNFGDHETLLVSHSVNAAATGTQAGVRWYELRNPGTSPVVYQQGTYAPDSTQRWMPSIAMDHLGNIAMVYSASSSSIYPGIRYAGRLASDPLGQMAQTEGVLISGGGSQTGTASRWGDYAMISVDPLDDCTFWMTSEYIPSTGTAPWETQIGAFAFPDCLNLGALAGVVRDQTTHLPLGNAAVAVQLSSGVGKVYQGVTNEAGEYQIDYLPAGSYTVSASLRLYQPAQISGVAVQAGATSNQDLALQLYPATIFAPYFSKNYLR